MKLRPAALVAKVEDLLLDGFEVSHYLPPRILMLTEKRLKSEVRRETTFALSQKIFYSFEVQ
jgi:hypothetical protein